METLRGYARGTSAGGPSLARTERYAELVAFLRARLRPAFPSPADFAAAAEIDLRVLETLPVQAPLIVTGATVLVQRQNRRRDQGWLSFLGVAHAALERSRGEHTEDDAAWLAAELAAPAEAVRELSLREAARRQPWLPARVLVARVRAGCGGCEHM